MFFLVRRFVAGETAEDAVRAALRLNQDGIKATLDFLGEECYSWDSAAEAAAEIAALYPRIAGAGADANVSIKLTQLGLSLDQGLAEDNVFRIAEAAARHGGYVRIDMEGSAYTQKTLEVFHRAFEKFRNVGVVIQAYLRRSAADIADLNKLGAGVRLCKGAYKEPSSVAVQGMAEVNERFDELSRELLLRGKNPAIATHDDDRIRAVMDVAAANGIAKDRFEFQMLYGVRRPRWRELVSRGYRMRVYVPYGRHWFPYYYRRIRERKENLVFAVRSLLGALGEAGA